MNEGLKQWSMQIVVVLLSVVGAGILWYAWQREYKSLTVSVDSCVSIVTLGNNSVDGLELLYNGKAVSSLSVVDISIKNSGNSVVRRDDFTEPVKIIFTGDIASTPTIIEKNPKQLNPIFVMAEDKTVELKPLLLNSDDVIRLRVNVLNLDKDVPVVAVDGRVVGVKNIEVRNKVIVDRKFPKENTIGFEIGFNNKSGTVIFFILCGVFIFFLSSTVKSVFSWIFRKVGRWFS
jgi:hypothetical protein